MQLTHIGFIFERELAVLSSTVEMSGTLPEKCAVRCTAFFGSAKSLETFLNYGRIFSVVICVHLNVRSAYVDLITGTLGNILTH